MRCDQTALPVSRFLPAGWNKQDTGAALGSGEVIWNNFYVRNPYYEKAMAGKEMKTAAGNQAGRMGAGNDRETGNWVRDAMAIGGGKFGRRI